MRRELRYMVEDYFRNSPSWPFTIDVEAEVAAFLKDEQDRPEGERFTEDEIRQTMRAFVSSLDTAR